MPEEASGKRVLRLGDLELDPQALTLRGPEGPIAAEPRVIELLVYLVRHRGRTVAKDELLEAVWGGRALSDVAVSRAVYQARRALGDDARRQEWIATVHGRGYRFVGAVAARPATAAAPARSARPRRGVLAVSLVALLLLAAGLGLAWWLQRPPSGWPPPVRMVRVAVVPPTAAREATAMALCEGIAARLATLDGVLVRRCRDSAAAAGEVTSLAALARRLGAEGVVHGALAGSPPVLELSLLTLGDDARAPLPSVPVAPDPAASPDSLAAACDAAAAAIGERLTGRRPAVDDRLAPGDMAAHGLYLRGAWSGRRRCAGGGNLELLVRVTSGDPGFAPAWVSLAEEHLRLAGPCGSHPGHYESALAALERAAELGAPVPVTASLAARALVGLGRTEAAYERLLRAERRGGDPRLDWAAAETLLHAGALDAARRRRERALEGDPDHARFAVEVELLGLELGSLGEDPPDPGDPSAYLARGLSSLRDGHRREAVAALRPAFRADPANQHARLAEALLAIAEGATDDGRRILDELVRARLGNGAGDPAIDYRIGQAYALAERPEAALDALRRAGDGGFLCAACADADPLWESLRPEPAFAAALRPVRDRAAAFARRFGLDASPKSP